MQYLPLCQRQMYGKVITEETPSPYNSLVWGLKRIYGIGLRTMLSTGLRAGISLRNPLFTLFDCLSIIMDDQLNTFGLAFMEASASKVLSLKKQQQESRIHEEQQRQRDHKAANYGNGQRLVQLRPGSDAKGEGQ